MMPDAAASLSRHAASSTTALRVSSLTSSSMTSASCAIKEVDLDGSDLRPGGEVRLSVDWMTSRCEDTGGIARPARDVDVTVTTAGDREPRLLGTVDEAAGPRFTVAGSFPLPDDLPIGEATLAVTSTSGEGTVAETPIVLTAG